MKIEIALMLMEGGKWVSEEMCGGCYAYFNEDLLFTDESPFRYFTSIEDIEFKMGEDTGWWQLPNSSHKIDKPKTIEYGFGSSIGKRDI